jgi:hypothetical protein
VLDTGSHFHTGGAASQEISKRSKTLGSSELYRNSRGLLGWGLSRGRGTGIGRGSTHYFLVFDCVFRANEGEEASHAATPMRPINPRRGNNDSFYYTAPVGPPFVGGQQFLEFD